MSPAALPDGLCCRLSSPSGLFVSVLRVTRGDSMLVFVERGPLDLPDDAAFRFCLDSEGFVPFTDGCPGDAPSERSGPPQREHVSSSSLERSRHGAQYLMVVIDLFMGHCGRCGCQYGRPEQVKRSSGNSIRFRHLRPEHRR